MEESTPPNNIVYYLLEKFIAEEKVRTGAIIGLSLFTTLIQTNGISYITANLIESMEKNNYESTMRMFKLFISISVLFMIVYYTYKTIQNDIVTKMMQWIKHEIFKVILLTNNENMCHVNFVEFITPITRISVSCYILFYDIISSILPTVGFLLVIAGFFLVKNLQFGLCFLAGNVLIALYAAYYWKDMMEYKNRQEDKINKNEQYLVDILNNIDKVIYRGQVKVEIDTFEEKTTDCIQLSNEFASFLTRHTMTMTVMVYIIIFSSIFYLIFLRFSKKMSTTIFITFFTILLLYRDKIQHTINNIPDYLEFIGRLDYVVGTFNKMLGEKTDIMDLIDKKYAVQDLPFQHIHFKNVFFKYKDTEKWILDDFNIDLELNDRIIGITGLSGKGKSSFVKLILRLYDADSGLITLDGVDIRGVDPNYIRANITYVNQNSKLFDKKILDNILYGCNSENHEICRKHLDEILEHSKIKTLFQNVDIQNAEVGSLGEHLSGGQRQIVNILSGLINPSKILILDEPTNALDADLKQHVLFLIKQFKKYKKSIIIITHDRDVFPLFDDNISI